MVAVLTVVAIVATVAPRGRATSPLRLAAVVGVGVVALAATAWQSWATGAQIARLTQADQSQRLAAQVKLLQDQVATLKESTRVRALGAEIAVRLGDYLRPLGRHKVVISCSPDDTEAYRYATEIADALKAAGWDARGPETTTIYGDLRSLAINVYDNGGRGSDTAKILLDGFAKFGIPYQSRVPPSEAMAAGTVELFIGSKPKPIDSTAAAAH